MSEWALWAGSVIACVGGAATLHAARTRVGAVSELAVRGGRLRRANALDPLIGHVWIAMIWGLPLALAVAVLLDVVVALPLAPVFCTIVVLALVGSGFTENRRVLSKGLRCAVAVAAAGVVAAHVSRLGGDSLQLESAVGIGLWLGGAVLLLASALIRGRER